MRTRTGVALAALVALVAAANGRAATFTVTRTDDPAPGACDSDCSLREAVLAANANAGADTIRLAAGRYSLGIAGPAEDAAATGDLDLTGSVTIVGARARTTSLDAAAIDRVFEVAAGVTVEITDLTITGGHVAGDGGGIRNAGNLTLLRDTISGNEALTSGNHAGGGVDSDGMLFVTRSTVSGNRAYNGGGINFAGSATVSDSTVVGNRAGSIGSNGSGGGIHGQASSALTLLGSTVADNHSFNGAGSGGGIDGEAALTNSIVANNLAHAADGSAAVADNCSGAITSNGHNLSSGSDCDLTAVGDRWAADPRLGRLQDNGGPTDSEALLAGSPAIDAGQACGALDQREAARPHGARCDIGAYEFAPPTVTTAEAASVSTMSASLRGSVTPTGRSAFYFFEYGTSPAYGSFTATRVLDPLNSAVAVSTFLGGLKLGTTYYFRLVAVNGDGMSFGAGETFRTLDPTKPVLRALRVVPGIFRAANGAKFTFNLSEAATVTLKIDRVRPGVRRGRRCVPKVPRRRGRACTRYLPRAGKVTVAGEAGLNEAAFDAKLNGRRLGPGAYRLRATPKDPSGNVGRTVIAAFRIVR